MTTTFKPLTSGKPSGPEQPTLDHSVQGIEPKTGRTENYPLLPSNSVPPRPDPNLKPQKIFLDHKRRVRNTPIDWLSFVIYVISVWGFLVLAIVLLLKATQSDSYATEIVYFALFLFALIALLVGVSVFQSRMKKRTDRERMRTEGNK